MEKPKITPAQQRALDKYKKNVKRITVDFPPTDAELWEHIQNQPKKQTYIKNLIRADMERQNHRADLQQLQAYLIDNEDKDTALKHNAGMDEYPSDIIEEFLKG